MQNAIALGLPDRSALDAVGLGYRRAKESVLRGNQWRFFVGKNVDDKQTKFLTCEGV